MISAKNLSWHTLELIGSEHMIEVDNRCHQDVIDKAYFNLRSTVMIRNKVAVKAVLEIEWWDSLTEK